MVKQLLEKLRYQFITVLEPNDIAPELLAYKVIIQRDYDIIKNANTDRKDRVVLLLEILGRKWITQNYPVERFAEHLNEHGYGPLSETLLAEAKKLGMVQTSQIIRQPEAAPDAASIHHEQSVPAANSSITPSPDASSSSHQPSDQIPHNSTPTTPADGDRMFRRGSASDLANHPENTSNNQNHQTNTDDSTTDARTPDTTDRRSLDPQISIHLDQPLETVHWTKETLKFFNSTVKHHCLGKDLNSEASIILSSKELEGFNGTEIIDGTLTFWSWSYTGDGRNMSKFFKIIGNKHINSVKNVIIYITDRILLLDSELEYNADPYQIEKLTVAVSPNLAIFCQEDVWKMIRYISQNMKGLSEICFNGMGGGVSTIFSFFTTCPRSVKVAELKNLSISESDAQNICDTLLGPKNKSSWLIKVTPTDDTLDSMLSFVLKLLSPNKWNHVFPVQIDCSLLTEESIQKCHDTIRQNNLQDKIGFHENA